MNNIDAGEYSPNGETPRPISEDLIEILEKGDSEALREGGWLAGAIEFFFFGIEAALLIVVLRAMDFQKEVVGFAVVWVCVHFLAVLRRKRKKREFQEMFHSGISNLKLGRYISASGDFRGALARLSYEPAWIGLVYSLSQINENPAALAAARDLYHEHLSKHPEPYRDRKVYALLLATPSCRTIAKRMESIFNGDTSEVFHYFPGALKRRLLQTVVGVFFVALVAFFLTFALTFR